MIDMISEGLIVARTLRNSTKAYAREVMQIVEAPKHTRAVVAIAFDDSDLKRAKFPHEDPLVILHMLGNSKVKQCLSRQWSFSGYLVP